MRSWTCPALATLLGLGFVTVLELPSLGDRSLMVVSNLGQLAAAVFAALMCVRAGRRSGPYVGAWRWLAVGVGAWAGGQVAWTYYEVFAGVEVPFPSLADVGFLVFPLASGVGLLLWLGSQRTLAARGRDLLDGAIIALSLLVLSWVTSLRAVVAEGSPDWLAASLSVAYPIGDVVLGTLVLVAVARGRRGERGVLLVLAAGLGALALADSAYLYLVSVGAYGSADVISSGWVFGFLYVGAAALAQGSEPRSAGSSEPAETGSPSLTASALPYVPLAAASVALSYDIVAAPDHALVSVTLGVTLVVLVLSRQFLAMVENQRLYAELGRARDLLQHQALHDHLTGLPNRALFNDRLDHALQRPRAALGLLFCDLDDFKRVNDERGHDAGDLLLKLVAERLLGCVRAEDTVARLGGDEFALLLENPDDTEAIAHRVVEQMRRPFFLDGHEAHVTMSVGVTHHWGAHPPGRGPRQRDDDRRAPVGPPDVSLANEPGAVAHWLLRSADQAMYAAKTSGKARAVMADDTSRVLLSPHPVSPVEAAESPAP